jgi:D-Tyr-tRNAtyr deacylase
MRVIIQRVLSASVTINGNYKSIIEKGLLNWQQSTSTRNVKGYGKQKYYIRRE